MKSRGIAVLPAAIPTLSALDCGRGPAAPDEAEPPLLSSPIVSAAETIPPSAGRGSVFSAADILEVERASLADFPWGMTTDVTMKETNETLAEYAEIARLAANPMRLIDTLLGEGLGALVSDTQTFAPTAAKSMGGVPTDVYETRSAFASHRWWIGTQDQRLYRLVSSSDAGTTTVLMEYDPGVEITPPIP